MLGAVALLGNAAAREWGGNFDGGGCNFYLVCQE